MAKPIALPSHLEQSEPVRERFERLKQREVILEVKNLGKTYKTAKGEVVALKDIKADGTYQKIADKYFGQDVSQ